MKKYFTKNFQKKNSSLKAAILSIIIMTFFYTGCSDSDKIPENNIPTSKSRIIKNSTNVIDSINTGFKGGLLSIFKLNAGRIIASGNNGLIITSSNGGLNWIQRLSNDTMNLYAASMLNTRKYIVAGENGRILRSADFGQTWNVVASPLTNTIKAVSFSDTLNGFAAYGSTSILKTNDGGLTWVIVPTSAISNLNGISSSTFTKVIACGDGGIITASTDGGVTWLNQTSNVAVNLNSIDLLNSSFGKIAGNSGVILTTFNGGASWNIDSTHTNANLRSISISNPNLSFSCGDSALLRKQNTGWIQLGVTENFHSISIPNNYCSAICDDEIRIVGTENCPCTHNVNLVYNESSQFWELTVIPDVNQNVRDLLRIEVGGTIEDHTISGWTQYTDNIGNPPVTSQNDYQIIKGNEMLQITNSGVQTTNTYDFLELSISNIDGNDIRCVIFKINSISTGLNITNYNVPLSLNFLNIDRTSCLTKRYIIDCTPL